MDGLNRSLHFVVTWILSTEYLVVVYFALVFWASFLGVVGYPVAEKYFFVTFYMIISNSIFDQIDHSMLHFVTDRFLLLHFKYLFLLSLELGLGLAIKAASNCAIIYVADVGLALVGENTLWLWHNWLPLNISSKIEIVLLFLYRSQITILLYLLLFLLTTLGLQYFIYSLDEISRFRNCRRRTLLCCLVRYRFSFIFFHIWYWVHFLIVESL